MNRNTGAEILRAYLKSELVNAPRAEIPPEVFIRSSKSEGPVGKEAEQERASYGRSFSFSSILLSCYLGGG